MKYLNIPEKYVFEHEIPISKFRDDLLDNTANKIVWCGALKPGVAPVEGVSTERVRFEEIHFLHCDLKDRESIYDVGKCIYKAIKYPCLIEYQVGEVTTIGGCNFHRGKKDPEDNVLSTMYFSHWLHGELLSLQAQKMIASINEVIRLEADLRDIYMRALNAILCFQLGGIPRAHADRIIHGLIYNANTKTCNEARQYCQPYEFHPIKEGQPQYATQKERSSKYILLHDYEELWYSFMKYEPTRRALKARGIQDVNELFDLDEYGNRW